MAKEKRNTSKPQPQEKKQNTPVLTKETTPFVVPTWLPLALILVATALLRFQYLDIPLERDESLYSYLGKMALSGGKPYLDFYEMKPPVLFYSYAILVGIFGYSGVGIHLAAMVLAVANTFFTYRIAKKLGGLQVAYLSATAYALWSLSPGVYGAYLMSENIQLVWSLPAILLALNYPTQTNTKQLFTIGFLLALSFLVKQTSLVLIPVIGVYWLSQWFSNRKDTPFIDYVKPILWAILGYFTPIILTIVGLWAIGSGKDAKFWLLEYPRLYANEVSQADADLAFGLMRSLVFTGYEGYFIIALLSVLALSLSKRMLSEKILLISWAALTVLTVAIGKRFYGHYWLFALPALSILGGLFFQELSTWLRQKMSGLGTVAVVVGFFWSIHAFVTQPVFYFSPPVADISRAYSPGNPYYEHQVFSNYLEKIIQPNDHLAVFGSDPQYFIYLNKKSPIRHMYFPFIVNAKFEKAMLWQNETVETFKKTQPEYVIFNNYPIAWMYQPTYSQQMYVDILDHISKAYTLVAYIENPAMNLNVEIKEVKNAFNRPTTASYIAFYKRK
jgi:Dolichyl-phosphate-mannose-protein mannosyltransferase